MRIWRSEDVAWRRIDRETVVVHLSRHWMFALNEAGGILWETLAGPLDGERLENLLSDPAASAFLADLAGEGLVESDSPFGLSRSSESTEIDPRQPRIEWREEVRRFAGQCMYLSGQSPLCNSSPSGS